MTLTMFWMVPFEFVGRHRHATGIILGTFLAILMGAFFYDMTVPVVWSTMDRALTPIVPAGGDLTIRFVSRTTRQCKSKNVQLTISDSRGLEYKLMPRSMSIQFDDEGAKISIPIPPQIAPGTALFHMGYDAVCYILGVVPSTHEIDRPAVAFVVKDITQ